MTTLFLLSSESSKTRIIFTFLVAFVLSIMTGINASGQNIEKYKAAAERGDANAQYELARCYHRGEGVEIDKDLACYWYFEAAMQGHVKAQCWAGLCAYGGVGMAKDYDIARYFLKQAIANGDPETKELAESGLAAMEYEIYSLEHPIEEDADSDDYFADDYFAEIFNIIFNEIQDETEGSLNGHEWVDLGLSVRWATCNVGASSPSEYGNYYAWGETTTKSSYTESNSRTYGKYISDFSGNAYYDAATANWGSGWRMPTEEEFEELVDKCDWKWTSQGGRNGYRVTGPNGNSIFLPAAGWRCGTLLYDAGENGSYWSSTHDGSGTRMAHCLEIFSITRTVFYNLRLCGFNVRPVSDK